MVRIRTRVHIGVCRLCEKAGPQAFERILPKAAGNNHIMIFYSKSYPERCMIHCNLTGQTSMRDLIIRNHGKALVYSQCADYN